MPLPDGPPRPPTPALDAFGHAALAVRSADGRILWQTPLARHLLERHFGHRVPLRGPALAPAALRDWVRRCVDAPGPAAPDAPPAPGAGAPWLSADARLRATLHPADGASNWLLVLTEQPARAAAAPGEAAVPPTTLAA